MNITSRREGRAIYVQQHVAGTRFAWNSLEEARELIRQVEALLRAPPARGTTLDRMWTWSVCRASLAGAALLAALAFSSASLLSAERARDDESGLVDALEPLTQGLLISALVLGGLGVGFLFVTGGIWVYRWWTPVQLRDVERYCTYWVNRHIVHLGGIHADVRPHVTAEVSQEADVHIGGEVVTLHTLSSPRPTGEFPQTPCALRDPPSQGDIVKAVVTFKPKWWQGRRTKCEVTAKVNINE